MSFCHSKRKENPSRYRHCRSYEFVSSSFTNRVSLLSLSDKSTVDVMGNVDVDCATVPFCSSCAIPPPKAGGLWCLKGVRGGTLWTGKPQARNPTQKRKAERPLAQQKHLAATAGPFPERLVHQIRGVQSSETPGSSGES